MLGSLFKPFKLTAHTIFQYRSTYSGHRLQPHSNFHDLFLFLSYFPSPIFLTKVVAVKKRGRKEKKPSLTSFDNISYPSPLQFRTFIHSPQQSILLITLAAPFDYYYTVFLLVALPYISFLVIFHLLKFFLQVMPVFATCTLGNFIALTLCSFFIFIIIFLSDIAATAMAAEA